MSAWVKLDPQGVWSTSGRATIVVAEPAVDGPDKQGTLRLFLEQSAGAIHTRCESHRGTSFSGGLVEHASWGIADHVHAGQWHHIACSFTALETRIFVDGLRDVDISLSQMSAEHHDSGEFVDSCWLVVFMHCIAADDDQMTHSSPLVLVDQVPTKPTGHFKSLLDTATLTPSVNLAVAASQFATTTP